MSKELPTLRIGNLEGNCVDQGAMSLKLTLSDIVSSVSNEGGFGTVGGAGLGLDPEVKKASDYFKASQKKLRAEIHQSLDKSNNGRIGVNLMVVATDYENLVRVAVESGAKFISSGAGLPLVLPKYVEKYRVSGQEIPALIPIISSQRAAKIILDKWGPHSLPAAFVVETPNTAGGHLGVTRVEDIGKDEFSLETVVPRLVTFLKERGLDIPVIAAGGIWSRKDIDEVLKLGAGGVQMATRFLTAKELNASDEFKEMHLREDNKIVVIKSPVGMPGRAIENDFIKKVNSGKRVNLGTCVRCLKACSYRRGEGGYCIVRALENARRGDLENGVFFTGTNGNKLKDQGMVTVREIFEDLKNED